MPVLQKSKTPTALCGGCKRPQRSAKRIETINGAQKEIYSSTLKDVLQEVCKAPKKSSAYRNKKQKKRTQYELTNAITTAGNTKTLQRHIAWVLSVPNQAQMQGYFAP